MTVQSDPGHEPFEKFLRWLSPNRELAFKKHDQIMQKIGKHFIRNGCPDSEDLAAETRERVVRIINSGAEYPNSDALFYSVADKVWKEYARKPKPGPLPMNDVLPTPWRETEDMERKISCLERCLARLPEVERDLITRYHQGSGFDNIEARKRLMAEHGGENSLRVKTFRIRVKLRLCINSCMDETESGANDPGRLNEE